MELTKEEQKAINRLGSFLLRTIDNEQIREDIESFILMLYFDILKKHCEIRLPFIVGQFTLTWMIKLHIPHIPLEKGGSDAITLRNEFLKEVFGLCAFTFGPDTQDDFELNIESPNLEVQKYFFSEVGSIKLHSLDLGLVNKSTVISGLTYLLPQ